MTPVTPLAERFWPKVDRSGGTNACWLWLASTKKGYGQLWVRELGRAALAHRISYELNIGEIPNGLFVCHTCDNPTCVNPNHLFLGTEEDNNRDCYSKGRGSMQRHPELFRGEHGGSAKVSEGDVLEMRRLRRDGVMLKDLAAQFGISVHGVHSIVTGKTWCHVGGPRTSTGQGWNRRIAIETRSPLCHSCGEELVGPGNWAGGSDYLCLDCYAEFEHDMAEMDWATASEVSVAA